MSTATACPAALAPPPAAPSREIPLSESTLHSPEFARDPYPTYARLRELGGIVRLTNERCYAATTYEAVTGVLRSRAATVDSPFRASRALFGRTVMDVDGNEHTQLRSLSSRAFSVAAVPAYQHTIVADAVRTVIDDLHGRSCFDAVADFADRVPIAVMSEVIGIPQELREPFRACSEEVIAFLDTATPDTRVRARAALARMSTDLADVIAAARAHPDHTLIGQLVTGTGPSGPLTDEEILRHIGLLIPAAIDTSNRLLANVIACLVTRPALLEQVAADPGMVPGVVDETLRFEPPIHTTVRIWTGSEICGVAIPRGALITVLLGSANRDPAVFAGPDTFDPGRDASRHVSFGAGRHRCMGRTMAHVEVVAAITELVTRCPGLRLAPGADAAITGTAFRSPTTLPLHYTPLEKP